MLTGRFSRRAFIQSLGLGAGAVMLNPIADTLISHAQGQASVRKRFIAWIPGSGLDYELLFTPNEFKQNINAAVMNGPTNFTLPPMLNSLSTYRQRMLLVDGLYNHPQGADFVHTFAYTGLSCMPSASGDPEDLAAPGGATLDQAIAAKLGGTTAFPSVLLGATYINSASWRDPKISAVFAKGRNQPLPATEDPTVLFKDLFSGFTQTSGGVDKALARKRVLFDSMRKDISRLQSSLAGTERVKLDRYLEAIEEYEKRISLISTTKCEKPANTYDFTSEFEQNFEMVLALGALALTCGMTNVLGVSIGAGNSHSTFPNNDGELSVGVDNDPARWKKSGAKFSLHDFEQSPSRFASEMTKVHNYLGGLLKGTLDKLALIQEGDSTVGDNTIVLMTSDTGERHHADGRRWPAIVIGDAGSQRKLNTGGRFFRFGLGTRGLADLYRTLGLGCGVDLGTFGQGGTFTPQGPITQFLL